LDFSKNYKLIIPESKEIIVSNKYLLVFFLFAFFSHTYSQNNDASKSIITEQLLKAGYENLRVTYVEKDLVIGYENRIQRFEVAAIKDLFDILVQYVESFDNLILVPQNRKIPLCSVKVSGSNLKEFHENHINSKEFGKELEIQINTDKIWGILLRVDEVNSTSAEFDFTIKPSFQFEFGPYSDPVLWQFNLIPAIRTSLWKGMEFKYEFIVPIHNGLSPREDSVRTGLAVMNQTLRFKNDFFVSASVGYFSGYRYGFDFDTKKYYENGESNFYLNFGCTSFASFAGKRFYYSDQFTWTAYAGFEHRIAEYDLTLGIMAGRFLMGDNSIRFDINREFSEIEIGFFAIRSTSGISNGGINITVPLFPSKYAKPSFIRFRPEENFAFSYLVKTSLKDLIGLRYNTGNRLDIFDKKLNPEFIRNKFQQDFK
jgi:hypothetical protein